MNVKSEVLQALEKSRGEFVSGGQLAEKLGVSRNAVWKAVRSLQTEGHQIDAVTNRGYCLSPEDTMLSPEGIVLHLRGAAKALRPEVYHEVTSTNTMLKVEAEHGEAAGKVIIAERQTMGKGRSGRSFYSPSDTGIYFSLLLRPQFAPHESLLITTAAAVAAARAIDQVLACQTGLRNGEKQEGPAAIKWVNDIIYRGKKVCGILTEASVDFETGALAYAVLGIGINITDPAEGFPEALRDVAGSLCGQEPCSGAVRSLLVAHTLNYFMEYYERLTERTFMEEYRKRSLVIGRTVEAYDGRHSRYVTVLDIDDDAALIAEEADGRQVRLTTGEVRVKL